MHAVTAQDLGTHDLVLCFGLIYHLENPVGALRVARALCRRLCVVETQVVPGLTGWVDYGSYRFVRPLEGTVSASSTKPAKLTVRKPPPLGICLVPSVEALVWIMQRIGFARVEVLPCARRRLRTTGAPQARDGGRLGRVVPARRPRAIGKRTQAGRGNAGRGVGRRASHQTRPKTSASGTSSGKAITPRLTTTASTAHDQPEHGGDQGQRRCEHRQAHAHQGAEYAEQRAPQTTAQGKGKLERSARSEQHQQQAQAEDQQGCGKQRPVHAVPPFGLHVMRQATMGLDPATGRM